MLRPLLRQAEEQSIHVGDLITEVKTWRTRFEVADTKRHQLVWRNALLVRQLCDTDSGPDDGTLPPNLNSPGTSTHHARKRRKLSLGYTGTPCRTGSCAPNERKSKERPHWQGEAGSKGETSSDSEMDEDRDEEEAHMDDSNDKDESQTDDDQDEHKTQADDDNDEDGDEVDGESGGSTIDIDEKNGKGEADMKLKQNIEVSAEAPKGERKGEFSDPKASNSRILSNTERR